MPTKYVKTFQCPSCEKPASGRGHLCHPTKAERPYKCEFCGKSTKDPRHACASMLESIEYICKDCGRLAPYDSLLCNPIPVDED
ncbi:MAG: hypothetical protein AABZ23_06200 [Deltaproteobacteria bacterium]